MEEAYQKLGGCPFIICLLETHLIKGSPGERNFIYLAKECKCVAYASSGEKQKKEWLFWCQKKLKCGLM